MRKILNDEEYKPPATIEDEAALEPIKEMSRENGFEKVVYKPDQKFQG